jgi:hypothetical protein
MNTEKMVFTASLSIHVILQLVIIILFGVTYMYIHKMEQAGCECAMHPYRNFIKYFPIFAVLYLLLTMLNPVIIMKQPSMAPVLAILNILYTLGAFVFFIMAIKYINFLVSEKCKCSEDVRREMVYYWSIVHIAIIAIGLLLVILDAIFGAIFMSRVPSMKHVSQEARTVVSQGIRTPLKSARSIPKRFTRLGAK